MKATLTFVLFLILAAAGSAQIAQSPIVNAVTTGTSITLQWSFPNGITPSSINILKKLVGDRRDIMLLTPQATLSGSARTWTDRQIVPNTLYEYAVSVTYNPYQTTRIYAGIRLQAPDQRGKCFLLVENLLQSALPTEINAYIQDLVGDGWQIIKRNVDRTQTPESVRQIIRDVYLTDRANVKCVILLGRVPIKLYGPYNPDGHYFRDMPCDVYYGDPLTAWPASDPNKPTPSIPGEVKLAVGRIDFANIYSFLASPAPNVGEVELVRRYLQKNHAYRQGGALPTAQGLLVVDTASWMSAAYQPSLWIKSVCGSRMDSDVAAWNYSAKMIEQSYLCYFQFGSVDPYLAYARDPKFVFGQVYRSFLGDYHHIDKMPGMLCGPNWGFTVIYGQEPRFHGLTMNVPVGELLRLQQNEAETFLRPLRNYHNLLGDPTLHMTWAKPTGQASAQWAADTQGGIILAWMPTGEANVRYRVYRSASWDGPYARIAEVSGTSYRDLQTPASMPVFYMVRALKSVTGTTGTFDCLSQGTFAALNP